MESLIITTELQNYAQQHSSQEPALLTALHRETNITQQQAHMSSGHWQGRLLSMISHLLSPALIVEVGTYTGYSALCLAEGLAPNGKLLTIEKDAEKEAICKKYFAQSAKASQIELWIGDAISLVEKLPNNIDLAFIDADKINYIHYYEALLPKLKTGACMLVDNLFFHGEVLQANSKNALAVHAFNQHLLQDTRVEKVLLPIRDGLSIIRKL
jgi:caffeoyl-CoA O-methyltransferase